MRRVTITISENEAPIIEESVGELKGRTKKVSFVELAVLFADYLKDSDFMVSSVPLIPKNVVGVKVYTTKIDYAVYIPAEIRPVIYYNDVYHVGYPHLLMFIGIRDKKVVNTKIFALAEEAVTEETPLHHYPFSNVHPDGDICWGTYSLPPVENVSDLDKIIRLFFALPTTGDLFSNRGMSYREFLMECQDKPFNNEYLSPTNLKYGDLFTNNEDTNK